MPPAVGTRVDEPRTPHPLSLCPLAEVFTDESGARSELAAARRLKMVVPPAAHRRRCSASAPLEVKIRSNIIALLDINTVQQTFTCHFFLDATWVRARRGSAAAAALPARRDRAARRRPWSGSDCRSRTHRMLALRWTPGWQATS